VISPVTVCSQAYFGTVLAPQVEECVRNEYMNEGVIGADVGPDNRVCGPRHHLSSIMDWGLMPPSDLTKWLRGPGPIAALSDQQDSMEMT
jgi:hypothetical protein